MVKKLFSFNHYPNKFKIRLESVLYNRRKLQKINNTVYNIKCFSRYNQVRFMI